MGLGAVRVLRKSAHRKPGPPQKACSSKMTFASGLRQENGTVSDGFFRQIPSLKHANQIREGLPKVNKHILAKGQFRRTRYDLGGR